ncbi:MAG: hypothetical protein ACJAWZ_004172, partial [Paracoccaceae bacterium]
RPKAAQLLRGQLPQKLLYLCTRSMRQAPASAHDFGGDGSAQGLARNAWREWAPERRRSVDGGPIHMRTV